MELCFLNGIRAYFTGKLLISLPLSRGGKKIDKKLKIPDILLVLNPEIPYPPVGRWLIGGRQNFAPIL
jgi:hypothetical protein